MRISQKVLPYSILFGGTILILIAIFQEVLLSPNHYFFGYAGDGLTPYFTHPYYLEYCEGVLYQGMNYPFGSHILYTTFPAFAWFLKFVNSFVHVAPYTTAILNYSIILSFIPAAWFTFKILKISLIPDTWAALFSLIITFLSPQIMRMTGHYALAFFFVVPLTVFLILKLFEFQRWRYYLALFVLVETALAFLHPYYAFFSASFMAAMLIVHSIQNLNQINRFWKTYLVFAVASLIPGLMLGIWHKLTSFGAEDLLETTYGLGVYVTGFEGIFLPHEEPYWSWWNQILGIRELTSEGYAYVGFPGLVILIFLFMRILVHFTRGKGRRVLRPVLPNSLRTSIWAVFLLLPVAMAYPYQFQLDWTEYSLILKHFRATGRLAWIFYQVYMTLCVFLLFAAFRILKQKRKIIPAYLMIGLAVLSWTTYAYLAIRPHQSRILNGNISQYPEFEADWTRWLSSQGKEIEDFQAILALPYFHFGSGKVLQEDLSIERNALSISLDTGLPLCNVRSARVAMTETWKSMQLTSHPLVKRDILEDLNDSRPLLLVYQDHEFAPGEQYLIDLSEPIGTFQNIHFTSLNLEKLASTPEIHQVLAQLYDSTLSEMDFFYVWNHFGEKETPFGMDTWSNERGGNRVFEGSLPGNSQKWVASLWVKLSSQNARRTVMRVYQKGKSGQMNRIGSVNLMEARDFYRGWAKLELVFDSSTEASIFSIEVKGDKPIVDHLLIYPEGENFWISHGNNVIYNNFILTP